MRQLRITSSRAPFRRSGLLITSVREPLTIGEFDLTGEQLVRVLAEPAFSFETRDAEDADWRTVPKPEQLPFEDLQRFAQAHDDRRADYLNSKALFGGAAQSRESAAPAGSTGGETETPAGATDGAGTQSTGAPDATSGADLQSGTEVPDKPKQSEVEQAPAPIVDPAPAKAKRGTPKQG